MRHAISAVVVSLFAIVFLHGAWAIRLLNPVFTRYLGAGLPGGPNVLLTVSGRSSVSEFDAPLRSRSGATTVIVARGASAAASRSRPGAK